MSVVFLGLDFILVLFALLLFWLASGVGSRASGGKLSDELVKTEFGRGNASERGRFCILGVHRSTLPLAS